MEIISSLKWDEYNSNPFLGVRRTMNMLISPCLNSIPQLGIPPLFTQLRSLNATQWHMGMCLNQKLTPKEEGEQIIHDHLQVNVSEW